MIYGTVAQEIRLDILNAKDEREKELQRQRIDAEFIFKEISAWERLDLYSLLNEAIHHSASHGQQQ